MKTKFHSYLNVNLKIGGVNQSNLRTGKDSSRSGPVHFPDPVPKNKNNGQFISNTSAKQGNTEEIIGATVGSIILIALVVAIVVVILRKRHNKGKHEVAETVNMRYEVEDAEEKVDMIRPQSFLN